MPRTDNFCAPSDVHGDSALGFLLALDCTAIATPVTTTFARSLVRNFVRLIAKKFVHDFVQKK